MIIGIMGTPIYSENLGCMALTYSLLALLKKIEKEEKAQFHYIFFDNCLDKGKVKLLEKRLGMERGTISLGHLGHIPDFLRGIKYLKRNAPVIKDILHCDVVIDITGGDSFSDIYGDMRFRENVNLKRLVCLLKKPLILAPQTYGPYINKKNESIAKEPLKHAVLIMARDKESQKIANTLGERNDTVLTTDIAFSLPYRQAQKQGNVRRVGINFSGLLLDTCLEETQRNFSIRVDYRKYAKGVLDYFTEQGYEVYLIPHVGLDKKLHDELTLFYQKRRIVSVDKFDSPVEIKSYISGMDLFIGARMHGTIAAFTAGVPCIPTAYSRKFNGVYDAVCYNAVVDLQKLTTEEAVQKTIELSSDLQFLKSMQKKSLCLADTYKDVAYSSIKRVICNFEEEV